MDSIIRCIKQNHALKRDFVFAANFFEKDDDIMFNAGFRTKKIAARNKTSFYGKFNKKRRKGFFMEQITFFVAGPSMSAEEVKQQLANVQCVVVKNGDYYTIEQQEASLLPEKGTVGEWIKKTNWIPSSAVEKEERADWRRPVLFLKKEKIEKIITPAMKISQLEKKIRLKTEYFTTLAETINDSVTAVDQEGTVLFWNTSAEETYGIEKNAIVGKKIGDHFQAESVVLNSVLQQGRTVRGEYHRPNENTHVLINASPVLLDGNVAGGIATEHDITNIMKLNDELDLALPMHVQTQNPFASIAGSDPKLVESLEAARKAAYADVPVHLTGEPGSGKEMIAEAIHYSGPKAAGPFITLNCGIIPEALLEMELFGYGDKTQPGKLEQATNGTLFIENIDKMPEPLREKLFASLNGTRLIMASILPASFDRLVAIAIDIPPLRNRKDDILALSRSFVQEFSSKYNKQIDGISPEAELMLLQYDWPGNVRELRNVIERCILLGSGPVMTKDHLPENIALPIKNDEATAIKEALQKTYGNKSAAAALLGISRGTLYNKMREYGL